MVYAPPKRRLTVDDYHRMGADGILGEDERVELLDGELYEMAPIGDDHIGGVIGTEFVFGQRLLGRAFVSTQNPIRLSDYSEPQPDIALLRLKPDYYRSGKARPGDILLLVEVAHSSLEYHRRTKLPRYAAAGIDEVWIVNLIAGQIEVYRRPTGGRYRGRTIQERGDTLAPLAFPDIVIRVDELIG